MTAAGKMGTTCSRPWRPPGTRHTLLLPCRLVYGADRASAPRLSLQETRLAGPDVHSYPKSAGSRGSRWLPVGVCGAEGTPPGGGQPPAGLRPTHHHSCPEVPAPPGVWPAVFQGKACAQERRQPPSFFPGLQPLLFIFTNWQLEMLKLILGFHNYTYFFMFLKYFLNLSICMGHVMVMQYMHATCDDQVRLVSISVPPSSIMFMCRECCTLL